MLRPEIAVTFDDTAGSRAFLEQRTGVRERGFEPVEDRMRPSMIRSRTSGAADPGPADGGAAICREIGGVTSNALLDGICACHRIDYGAELYNSSIAHQFNGPAMVLGQERIDDLAPQCFQSGKCPGFVLFDEGRVPDDVRRKDRRQPTFDPWCHGRPPG